MRWAKLATRWLALLVAVLVSLEIGSRVALLVLGERTRTEQGLLVGREKTIELAPDGTELPAGFSWMNDEIIHPFLGYVLDQPEKLAANHGLLGGANPIGRRRPGELRLAILGGSVAQRVAAEIAAELERALHARAVNLRVVLVQLAYPGYKQPQQLQLLTYLLSLGAELDLVVNVDGYNELALSIVENHAAGVYPFFPRRWDQRVARVPDTDRLREIGRLTALRDLQGWILTFASISPLRHLAVVQVASELALRQIDPAIDEARERLRILPIQGTFEAHGPFRQFRRMGVLIGAVARNWSRSSVLLDRLATGAGAEYHHVLQPNQYVPGSKSLTEEERQSAYQPGPSGDVIRDGYPVLLHHGVDLRRRGVRFHDATQVYADIRETMYIDVCCHVNQEGDNKLAAFVVEQILATTTLPALGGGGES